MMIPTTLFLEPHQERKIQTALRKQKGCQIKARKLHGPHPGFLKGGNVAYSTAIETLSQS